VRRAWLTAAVTVLSFTCVGLKPVAAQRKGAQYVRVPDSSVTQIVKLRDGSTLIGRFVAVEGETLAFETSAGRLSLRRADLLEVREVAARSMRNGRFWPADPNPTRLFFGPTARSLPRGEGDFSNTYLFFLSGAYGLGGNAQLGGGMSVFPFDDFTDNIFFLTGKLGINAGRYATLAVGGLLGWAGGFGDELGGSDGFGLGAFYGVGTFGSGDHSLTAGVIFPYAEGDVADEPVLIVGGEARVHRSIKLVSENYFSTSGDVEGVFSYGLRIFNEKISVGLAFLNSSEDGIFPGLPYVDFVVRF
jgi:hypothetical protein